MTKYLTILKQFRISPELDKRIRDICIRRDMSYASYIRQALISQAEKYERGQKR